MRSLFIMLFSLFTFSGCSNLQVANGISPMEYFSDEVNNKIIEYKDGYSYVMMYRKPAIMFGAATELKIFINGTEIGTLDNLEGAYLIELNPGRHEYEIYSDILGESFLQAGGIVTVKRNEKKIVEFDTVYSQVKQFDKSLLSRVAIKEVVTVEEETNVHELSSYVSISNEKSALKNFNFKISKTKKENSYALIIGIKSYDEHPNVEYADNSAIAFKALSEKTLGIPKENIITLVDQKASSGQIKSKVALLRELAEPNGNLYLYYAGHGVPGKDGKAYMLPSDMSADSIHLEPELTFEKVYANLEQSSAKNVFIFVDACFSGKDDAGKLLYKGVAPVLKTTKTELKSKRVKVLTAGRAQDFANDYIAKEQRMFTYFLVNELSNGNKDLDSVYTKVRSKVKRSSLQKGLGYKQIPQNYGTNKSLLY